MGETERHERKMAELRRGRDEAFARMDRTAYEIADEAMNFERMRHFYRLKAIREANPAPGFKYNHC